MAERASGFDDFRIMEKERIRTRKKELLKSQNEELLKLLVEMQDKLKEWIK